MNYSLQRKAHLKCILVECTFSLVRTTYGQPAIIIRVAIHRKLFHNDDIVDIYVNKKKTSDGLKINGIYEFMCVCAVYTYLDSHGFISEKY